MREDDNDHVRAERSQLDGQGDINPQPSSEGTSPGPGKQRSGPPVQPQSQEAADVQRSLAPPSASNRAPPRRVDHTYRDYSSYPLSELPSEKKSPTNFPSKLHQILAVHEYSHIISWMPHGRAWKIHNKELLISEVVPKYFVQSKYESFTRQLNGWGFMRLHQSGNDYNAYYHECFLRGCPLLTGLMKRVAPNQGKLLPHMEGEPNFYEIDKQFPLPHMMPPVAPHNPVHYPHYSPSNHMPDPAVGYGSYPPDMQAGYPSPSGPTNYLPGYPENYPPQPPPHYVQHGDPHGAPHHAPQPGYPPYHYHYYPMQYPHQAPPEHYPHYPYPPRPHQHTSPTNFDHLPGHPQAQASTTNHESLPPGPGFPTNYEHPPPAFPPRTVRSEDAPLTHVPGGAAQEISVAVQEDELRPCQD